MLVQPHGEETKSATSSEQSARDGCSVSQQETSARAVFAPPVTSVRCLTVIENYRSELIWRVMRGDRCPRRGSERAGFSASCSPSTPDSPQRRSGSPRRATQRLRLRRRSGRLPEALRPPSKRTRAAAVHVLVLRACGECIESLTEEAGRKGETPPAGGVNERRCGGKRCDRSWPTTLRKMRQRDRPRPHCIWRSRLEQRASDSHSVSSG